jgi:hypothetical protein
MKIAGIDVSRGKITVCILDQIPADIRKIKKKTISLKADSEGIRTLIGLEFDGAVLEPTGMHYSRIWAHHLRELGREVRWIGHQEIASYRESWKINNKTDHLDAIALACYGLERWDRPHYFIHPEGERIRDLYFQLQHLNRAKNPVVNRLRQQLSSEFPEVAERVVKREWLTVNPPGLWRFVADEGFTAKWKGEYKRSVGIGLSTFTRGLARQLCEIERQEYAIEKEIQTELGLPEYQPYLEVFQRYAIGNRTAAALLSSIYPIEQFLDGNRQISEYSVSENGKRSRKNRSLGAFKLACGLGTVYYQSGDSKGWKPGGRATIRTALWQWAKMAIVISPDLELEPIAKLRHYYENGSVQTVNGKTEVFQPGIRNQKIMRVVRRMLEMLYRDLIALKS